MCKGYFVKEQKHEMSELRRLRSLSWTIVCGYADPKKLPANQMEWWPMEGDFKVKRRGVGKMTKRQITKVAAAIKRELERGK